MLSNEVFRTAYVKPVVHMSVYYFVLFSVFAVIFSYLFNSIEPIFFVAAGILSLGFFFLYLSALVRYFEKVRTAGKQVIVCSLSIFVVMNVLYFLNLIPPIPLSLREAGVYHSVTRSGSQYKILDEKRSLIERVLPVQTIHIKKSDRVFVFSSIFAPTKLNTTVVHNWQIYDEEKHAWIQKDRLSFSMTGGRNDGYRGYSVKTSVTAGLWRVDVETKRGQILGRVRFRVENVVELPKLIGITR